MATVPEPRTWTTGEKITGAKLNENRDALDYLMDPPRCHLYNGAGITITDTGTSLLETPDTVINTDSMMTSGASRVKFTTEGRYRINIFLGMPQATYTTLTLDLRINGGGSSVGGTRLRLYPLSLTSEQVTISLDRDFDAGDYLEPWIHQTSGGSRVTAVSVWGTGIQATWVSL